MNNPDMVITDEFVFVDGEIIPLEDFDFGECPMTEDLLGIILGGEYNV